MKGLPLFLALLLAATSRAHGFCEQQAPAVGSCFAVHAELRFYNGNPTFRLWPVGTRRLLGVRHGADERPLMPQSLAADVAAVVEQRARLFADFVVCPLTPSRPGRMQMVCVESARHLRSVPLPQGARRAMHWSTPPSACRAPCGPSSSV